MRYMAEGNEVFIQNFGNRIAGTRLSRSIARLYSQHTKIRAGTDGLRTWSNDELMDRLTEAEMLVIAGLASSKDSSDYRRYLRRAGEIFEWSITSSSYRARIPVEILAASAYQLAGFPARASGVLSENPPSENTSKILDALLRADFPEAQRQLIETWQMDIQESEMRNISGISLLDQVLHAIGVLVAWLRWGEDNRIGKAITILQKISNALHHDSDPYSWLLAVLFSEISQTYQQDALWKVLSPLSTHVSEDGNLALQRYSRVAYLERKLLAWPSQQAGISGIINDGSFALCTPTGSGKTRVAELVILRHLFNRTNHQNTDNNPLVLYLAPSRALSAEVEATISESLRSIQVANVSVTSLYGGNDFGPSDFLNLDEQPTVLISTHEKADAILRFFGPSLIDKISCVIVDEAHTAAFTGNYDELVNAQSRSLRLEVLVSRLKTLCSPRTIFVALSAVAAEMRSILSAWVTGENERPAIAPDYRSTRQLFGRLLCDESGATKIEYNVLDGQLLLIEDEESAPYIPSPFPPHPATSESTFPSDASVEKRMRAHLLWAAMHFTQSTGGERHSVLISVTEHIEYYAKTFLELLSTDWAEVECPDFFLPPDDVEKQGLLLRCLASCEDYFGSESREYRLLKRGIVLHHGKMPPVMSRLLIELIQAQVINIVIATSTISEGVNLPFETVLVPSLLRGPQEPINPKEIINVAGRAGRPGISTEGRTLVLLSTNPRSNIQRKSRIAYDSIIRSMTEGEAEEAYGPQSPLNALMVHIARQWSTLSRSNEIDKFIQWLENTAYYPTDEEDRDLLTSLDTFDHQLLAGIEEFEGLNPGLEVEEFLQSLWHNTLARHDTSSLRENVALEMFTKRGMVLIESVYPQREQRRRLYNTGLPPRDGNVLITKLSDLKSILQEGVDYVTWNTQERINHFIQLVETISQIDAFKIKDLSSRVKWTDVLEWWMSPDSAELTPTPIGVSTWYKFASQYFIYGLNWAIGSVIGSILERDGGKGHLLTRWTHCELPWSVIWYKDMISWGILDPIASYVLSKKEAFTRPKALQIARGYWESVGEIIDAILEPGPVSEWMREIKQANSVEQYIGNIPDKEIPVKLTEDFSGHMDSQFRVLPAIATEQINWLDPAGYLLARSTIPINFLTLDIPKIDFILNPTLKTITWEDYV